VKEILAPVVDLLELENTV
jgi:hypothetical protein